jgi:hypothetical protein
LVPHRNDRDRIHVGVVEQLAIVAGRLRHAEFRRHRLEPIRGARAQRGELQIGNAQERVAVDFAKPAESDHPDAKPVYWHGWKSPRIN